MMQQRSLVLSKTYYAAVCSSCGKFGEEAETAEKAHNLALGTSWTYRTIWPEGEKVYVYTCPECQAMENHISPAFDYSPIYATPLDPDCERSDANPGL